MTCYLINKLPWASLEGKVTEEVWTYNPIDLNNLGIFGCPSYVHISIKINLKLIQSQISMSSLVTQKA